MTEFLDDLFGLAIFFAPSIAAFALAAFPPLRHRRQPARLFIIGAASGAVAAFFSISLMLRGRISSRAFLLIFPITTSSTSFDRREHVYEMWAVPWRKNDPHRSVALLIQADFTPEEAIEKCEVGDREDDSDEPPNQTHAQAVSSRFGVMDGQAVFRISACRQKGRVHCERRAAECAGNVHAR